jgi:hypothetical protein
MDDECIHLLTPSTCAYCTGSYDRERKALAAETRRIVGFIAAKNATAPWGATTTRGWTRAN